MTDTRFVTWAQVEDYAASAVSQLPQTFRYIYGIPRGGCLAAQAMAAAYRRAGGTIEFWETTVPIDTLAELSIPFSREVLVVDDIYDSGKTLAPYLAGGITCAVLVTKDIEPRKNLVYGVSGRKTDWVVFPWEQGEKQEQTGPADAVRRLLQFIGEDPDAPHLQETPRRYLAWLNEFRADREPDFQNTKFEVRYDGMVIVRAIPFTSLCAHHLLPFSGKATVAYIPSPVAGNTKASVLGLSKLARIVQHHAGRLQSQEEMTTQIQDAIRSASGSDDVAVVLSAEHSCMNFRGPRVPGAETITSSISGVFWSKPEARAEFMSLAHASA